MDSESWPPPAPGSAVPRSVTTTLVDDGAVFGGVARDLGVRTGIDPLWFRLAFVGLSAFSGLGVVLYIGSWLFLRGQRRSRVSWLSVLGVVVIVGGCIVLLGEAGTNYVDSPWTIVLLLAGATVALWQPRAATGPGRRADSSGGRRCIGADAGRGAARATAAFLPRARDAGARPAGRRSRGDRLPDRRRRAAP